jgi:hypothetical protein
MHGGSVSIHRKLFLVSFAGAALALLVVTGLFFYRPALVIGVHGNHLGESISNDLGRHSSHGLCHEVVNGRWDCSIFVEPDPGSGGGEVAYRAESEDSGCWHARTYAPARRRADLTGCISVLDLF